MGGIFSTNHIAEFNVKHYEGFIVWLSNRSSVRVYRGNNDIDISLCYNYEFDDWYDGDRLDKMVLNMALTCKEFYDRFDKYRHLLYLGAGRIMIWSRHNIIYRQTFSFGFFRVIRQCWKEDNHRRKIITKQYGKKVVYLEHKHPDRLNEERIYYPNAFEGESVCYLTYIKPVIVGT